MQSLIKQALALTEASEAAKWTEVESALKPAQLDSKSLAEVAIHFANNQKGSQAFWDELQSVSANKLNTFNREDLAILSRAMILHPYEVDEQVGEQISAGIDYFCQEEIDRQKRQDPYFLAKVISIIQSGLGPYAFRAGPGFFGGAVVDDVNNEEELESDDDDLSAHQVSHVKSTLIDLKSNTASKSLVQEDILAQAKKILEENDTLVGDIKGMN